MLSTFHAVVKTILRASFKCLQVSIHVKTGIKAILFCNIVISVQIGIRIIQSRRMQFDTESFMKHRNKKRFTALYLRGAQRRGI